jgi:DNA polymerase III epsilon subunit-like protein
MYLFFDTETNGLPKNMKADPRDLENWPRVIQLAWILLDKNFNEIDSFCELIAPDGWEIPNEKFWIDNGYSTEKNRTEGVEMEFLLPLFCNAINRSKVVIAHNMNFDSPVITAEMLRYDMRPIHKPKKVCTMLSTINLCALPGKYGHKWPKLEELHERLFGVKFENAHDALADVRATVRCFKELTKLGIISV